jgi:predicted trehalose synthase
MLRSFAYARGTVAARLELRGTSSAAGSVAWERLMRTNFLDAYLSTAAAGGAPFLPHSPADVQAAIAAWELDKTVYEVQYELNNRPDWLWIPLSGMLKYGTPNS